MALIPMGRLPAFNAGRLGHDRIAVEYGGERLSWGELDRRSTQRARALQELGVGQDDFVTIALPNSAVFHEIAFAVWKLGATPHIVSSRLPERELAAIIEVAKPRVVVASAPELIRAFEGHNPAGGLCSENDTPLPEAAAKHWKAMSSGGSTGRPKIIVAHTAATIDPEIAVIGIPRDECVVNPGPLYHNAPFSQTHIALFRGSKVVGQIKFDPEETLKLIEEHRATWINMVPTMMLRIWRLPRETRERYDLSSLNHVWHMAAPMPAWLKDEWIEWLGAGRIWEFYGGTEGQGATVICGTEWLSHRGSVGRPVNSEMKILDESQSPLPAGKIGEIYMRPAGGRDSTYHYLGAEARRGPDGFESIGDFGWMDSEGYLYLADRRTDLILSGGANIYPAEVEAALMEHPKIEVAVVIGLPHEDLGAAVHAIVRPRSNCLLEESELRAFVAERLALYKTPRTYEFTSEPLRDDAGKVRRTQLREHRVERSGIQLSPGAFKSAATNGH